MDDTRIPMTVLRDGYWEGQYPRAGAVITVPAGYVEQLELAGFAQRRDPEPALAAAVARSRAKGSTHGR